ncbi:MAG TPA: hypothetical protein VJ226_11545 [Bradyrhizobium sp.]|nr:hypothetical protein [Bradyrhizobium sp.]
MTAQKLIVLSGLPGSGKSEVAEGLSRTLSLPRHLDRYTREIAGQRAELPALRFPISPWPQHDAAAIYFAPI